MARRQAQVMDGAMVVEVPTADEPLSTLHS